ncbi:hypothetical protein DOY81_011096 [Sarcophaga bullata]|nr:hypothetical protein DOY81_011096 [Sarcophaga bullata]
MPAFSLPILSTPPITDQSEFGFCADSGDKVYLPPEVVFSLTAFEKGSGYTVTERLTQMITSTDDEDDP